MNTRKVVSLVLAFVMLLSVIPVANATDVPTITVGTSSIASGMTEADVSVNISGFSEIPTVGLKLVFTLADGLTISSATLSDAAANAGLTADVSGIANGIVSLTPNSTYLPTGVNIPDGELIALGVTVDADVTGTLSISLSDTQENYQYYSDPSQYITGSIGNVSVGAGTITVGSTMTEGYTAQVTAPSAVTVNNTVEVNIGVGHDTDTTFHAAEVILKYDVTALELITSSLGEKFYTNSNGVLTFEDFDNEHTMGTGVYTVQFKALKTGETTVTLDDAKFLDKAAASGSNLIPATITTNTATINVNEVVYDVTTAANSVTDGLTIPAEVTKGTELVIDAADTNLWDYTITAKIGDAEVDVTGPVDGKFTISKNYITGDIELTTSRSGKEFEVEWTGNGAGDVTDKPTEKPTYMTEYQFTVPSNVSAGAESVGYTYAASVSIEGSSYTMSGVAGSAVTIPGNQITGKVTITISKDEVPANGKTITINGQDVKFSDGTTSKVVSPGTELVLNLTVEPGYNYSVKIGENEIMNNNTISYTLTVGDSDVTIVVNKTLITENLVTVYDYVTENSTAGLKLWLVVFDCTLAEGKIPTYGGANMFWSGKYGTDGAYCYLVETASLDIATASARLDTAAATASTITYSGNVNGTTLTDAADAQFVANMYNAMYAMNETGVTMAKFLEADMNGDHVLNINDAQAIVKQILGITG